MLVEKYIEFWSNNVTLLNLITSAMFELFCICQYSY